MESRPNSLHSSPAILLKSFQSLNDPYSLNFLASVHSTMQTIKIALLTFLCLSAAVATAAPMTEAQLERTINTAAEHFTRSTRAANANDLFGACSSARKGLEVFYTIDPQRDVPRQYLPDYNATFEKIKILVQAAKNAGCQF
jgi:L-aminopeptidase/D-esterase-like protein